MVTPSEECGRKRAGCFHFTTHAEFRFHSELSALCRTRPVIIETDRTSRLLDFGLSARGYGGAFSLVALRTNLQAMMHSNEPINAEIRSSNVILIWARPKSMCNNQKRNPPTSAPSIPTPMLLQKPK